MMFFAKIVHLSCAMDCGLEGSDGAVNAMSDSLDFRLLRYIVAVAETANFTRAAERLYLAQPSLSKQIKDLEEDLRFPIFERSRNGVHATPAGEMVLAYAKDTLKSRDELITMARAVHFGQLPALRVGFSTFVNAELLKRFHDDYCAMFPRCEIQLAGGDQASILEKIRQHILDCAVLLLPISGDHFQVQQVASSPLVVCLRSNDATTSRTELDIREIAPRIKVFPDPQAQPAAYARFVALFRQLDVPMQVTCLAGTPAEIQWMVKAGYGLALIDQLTVLDAGLTTRPLTGLDWTVDTAFVYQNRTDHIALSFLERSLAQRWKHGRKTPGSESAQSEQLRLLA